jgi:Transcriptional regulator
MKTNKSPTRQRDDALSKQRIVDAAISILDSDGEEALTFRALASSLQTGSGAIYWHVANKNELLFAAMNEVIIHSISGKKQDSDPIQAIRNIALLVFELVEEHPWLGNLISREPWQPGILLIIEEIAGSLQKMDIPEEKLFDFTSVFINYIFGVTSQNAANARGVKITSTNRLDYFHTVREQWASLDPVQYPAVKRMAKFIEHNDNEQFLEGIDLILSGIVSLN